MNIVNKLTIRQLKLNKKRTLVTIVGVIISVAMITAVATIGVSFLDLLQRQTINNEGEWHVLYENVNRIQLEAIKEDEETKTVILSRDVGYAPLNGSKNQNKPYVFISEYNKHGFEKFPMELNEGRFPENANEIVISEAIVTNAKVNYKIGDVLTFDIGQRYINNSEDGKIPLSQREGLSKNEDDVQEVLTRETTKTYKIVGIIKRPTWEPTWSPGYTVLSYVDQNSITSVETTDVGVILNNIDTGLFEHGNNIAKINGIDKVSFNNSLLRYYGVIGDDSLRSMLFNLSAIIMGIIMVGSISLIYNAFAISVSERSRHLGMLSSVGATKRQKKNSVFFEGFIIGSISIPAGIVAGLVGIYITFLCINPMIQGALGVTEGFRVVILPSSIFIAVIVSIITILVSTYVPARRASNISAIDAIRQTADVKFTDKQVKTSKSTRKIFGIEGDLGLKNLKRNKARYRATVLSLIISMVLFLVVSSFTSGLKKSLLLSQEGINFDIEVSNFEGINKQDIIQKITSLDNITESTNIDRLNANSWIMEDSIADYLKDNNGSIIEDGKYLYDISINALDDETLKSYAKEVGVDFNLLKDTEKISAIVIDTIKYKDAKEDKYVETKIIKTNIGEKLNLNFNNMTIGENIPLKSVEIVGLTDKMPMGVMPMGASARFDVILSKDAFNKIVEDNKSLIQNMDTTLFFKSNNPLRLQEDIEEIQNVVSESNIYVFNVFIFRQREEQMVLLMSVFIYGFISLITAICIANIFNTISTSIALRKREFAMLKSVGMTPKGFNKMINYESIFYGMKALLYGLPISLGMMYLIHRTLMAKFNFGFTIPWSSIYTVIVAVFVIVSSAMLYSSAKVKKENIIDVLKQEII